MNTWVIKTYKDWANAFTQTNKPFVAIDEVGINYDYGKLTAMQKNQLFEILQVTGAKTRRWGLVRKFFDQFYHDMKIGDLVAVGIGKTSTFSLCLIGRVVSDGQFVPSVNPDYRHQRKIEVLWEGTPIEIDGMGWAKRLEKMDTFDKLKKFMDMFTKVV